MNDSSIVRVFSAQELSYFIGKRNKKGQMINKRTSLIDEKESVKLIKVTDTII